MNSIKRFIKNLEIKNYILYIFILLILSCFTLTYILLIPDSELVKDKSNILRLLLIDTVLVIILIGLTIRQITLIFINRKKNLAASRLYIKFINLFTLISLIPTIGVIIIAGLFYNLELQTWFGPAVKSTIINSNVVADDYLKLKTENLKVNTESIGRNIYNLKIIGNLLDKDINRIKLNHEQKNLQDIYIFNSLNEIISYSSITKSIENFIYPTEDIFKILDTGKIYITQKENNTLTAYYKLNFFDDAYLMINDDMNETIYNHLFETAKAITAYNNLEKNTTRLQISFSMIFVLFSLCLLLIAILIGFRMAHNLSKPITNLIESSKKVSKGDFNAKVSESDEFDEISLLLKSFNQMIVEIEIKQKQLIEKNIEIENRRLFTEAVLTTLSTGVIALDNNYNIRLINKAASNILGISENKMKNKNFFDFFDNNLENIKSNLDNKVYKNLNQQIEYNYNNNIRNLFIKFSLEILSNKTVEYVVTIDDLTSLILAEKHAAWSDVARKIAHEIKNPLTPIKLSAERIERKINENNYNKDTFVSLAKTISRQVDDIGKLIDEFSSFARLPKPEIIKDNFAIILKENFEIYLNSHTDINFKLNNQYKELFCFIDKFQMSLVLTNLTKNAIEAVKKLKNPSITFEIYKDKKNIILNIIDNGIGIDKDKINKIFMPYYTTKDKGTGLGLSICKKIIEDHGGEISMKKNKLSGSTVTVLLPI